MTEPEAFRFSKFYLSTLFDGRTHLVRRGEHFPAHWDRTELTKKLRAAAWWRGTTVRLTHGPDGVWVQSAEVISDGMSLTPEEREQWVQAMDENTRLKQELMDLRRENWQLKNQ